jgi:PKD repeat protein
MMLESLMICFEGVENMNKLLRVLILLGIFLGFGISCASAANVVSFNPQTVDLHPGSSQNVQIVMDEVPNGLSGFNITISVLDPEIAEIAAVSFPGWNAMPKNSTIPSSSVWIKVSDLNDQVVAGNTNVLLGTITLTGKKAGTSDLSIPKTKISDDNGSLINPVVNTGKINVTSVQTTPTITWSNLADITYGTALSITQLNAVASVPGTFTYNPVVGTVLSAGAKTLHVDFTPTDTANYNTASKDVTINVLAKPITPLKAAFDLTPTSGTAPLTVNFTDKSTNAASIRWDFGDKSGSSTNSKPSHTYTTAGTYTVTLTAFSSTNSDVTTRTITVTKPVKLKIKAIKADVTRGNAPLTVRFSCDVSGKPTSSIWTINKETIKGDAIGRVTNAFTKAGVYDVTLVVKDATGHSDSMTNKGFITVLARVKPPDAYFSAKPTYGKASLTVKFMDKSKNNPTSWK